jgi:N-acetylmuramic acid 6-phosphate etherase
MPYHIAIEAGATSSRAGLYDESYTLLRSCEGSAANPLELGVSQSAQVLLGLIRSLVVDDEPLDHIVAGVAGAGKGHCAEDLAEALLHGCSANAVSVGNDILPLLHANLGDAPGIMVIAGTGSSVIAQSAPGVTSFVGGHGALIGDRGSAYRVGIEALYVCSAMDDATGPDTALLSAIMGAADSTTFDDLIVWAHSATKPQVAALAPTVIACAEADDALAQKIVDEQACHLADQVMAARRKAGVSESVPLYLYGGLLHHAPTFTEAFTRALKVFWPEATPEFTPKQGLEAVATLLVEPRSGLVRRNRETMGQALLGTERMLLSDKPLDTMTALEITDWMTQCDAGLHGVMRNARLSIAEAIETAAEAFRAGGRVIYLGAGTSGRLGVLDASECPPTFGVSKEQVVGLIAGGDLALRNSIEGAEDSPEQAQRDLEALATPVSKHDFVIGITASGTAPYVHGALAYAKSIGAKTALIACNPTYLDTADLFILLETGAEVLPGSTRLKAGTATKLALNQITTGAMARCGHIYEGYMVGVKSVNIKLRERTIRITGDLLKLNAQEAEVALDAAGGDIKVAVLMHRCGVDIHEAQQRLDQRGGYLREALAL